MRNSEVPRRALLRAAELCGGVDTLGDALNVQKESLEAWLAGDEDPPMPVFIQAVGLILDAGRQRPPGSPDPSDGGRKGNRH